MGSWKELYSIREWSPLNLNEQIPATITRVFFSKRVKFTCVDATDNFLAIGSDVGIVFWYNRQTGETHKLRAEPLLRITCVKIVDSVEYMVAAGTTNGFVSVFQIPKALPENLNLVAPCTRSKPIERYTIRDLHRLDVSCCEWSQNGMKLYSGDRSGLVVLTEFDYQTHLSKSSQILSEDYEIVQLSVHKRYLLVSTLYRSIVCQRNVTTGLWHITQIGKKDRKQLIDCGGIFLKGNNINEPQILSGRPGLRFWLADTAGNVEKTLIFREAVARSPTWEIPILNPKLTQQPTTVEAKADENETESNNNFRNIYVYAGQDTLIVTHDDSKLYILNIDSLRVEAVARGFRKILDFSVCNKEIFVLEGERSLLRLAPLPEKPNKMAQIIFNPLMPPPLPILGAAATSGLFEAPVEYEPEEQSILNAEECFELPPIEKLNLDIPIQLAVESPRSEQNRLRDRLEILNQIGKENFDEQILYQRGKIISKSKNCENKLKTATISGIVEIGHIAEGNEDTLPAQHKSTAPKTTQPVSMEASLCQSKIMEKVSNDEEKLSNNEKEDLSLPHLSPIAAEELERAHALANLAPLQLNATTPLAFDDLPSFKSSNLKLDYPKQLEDAQVQTTPPKKIYYIQQQAKKQQQTQDEPFESAACGDYSAGQPVDDVTLVLRATNLVEDTELIDANVEQEQQKQQLQLAAVKAIPLEDVTSFLPDFKRIRDPMRKSPPPSGGSGTSSEWDFLDN